MGCSIRSSSLERLVGMVFMSLVISVASACATVVSSVTSDLSNGLSQAVLDSEDLEGVRDGAPAFLLLLDGLLVQEPRNERLLVAAAQLNGAYATAFVDDPARQALLSDKALNLAQRAACIDLVVACAARDQTFAEFSAWVARLQPNQVATSYALAVAWAAWIQVRSDDWDAIAELARVKALMARIADLDESYDHGGPQLYLGVFETLLPPAMGGRPELGREHFERAIELSDGRYLMVKVLYAERYARLLFDRELHDRLLNEVLAAEIREPGLTLVNRVAQERARVLLAGADDYF
jgi:hypothetical protein